GAVRDEDLLEASAFLRGQLELEGDPAAVRGYQQQIGVVEELRSPCPESAQPDAEWLRRVGIRPPPGVMRSQPALGDDLLQRTEPAAARRQPQPGHAYVVLVRAHVDARRVECAPEDPQARARDQMHRRPV